MFSLHRYKKRDFILTCEVPKLNEFMFIKNSGKKKNSGVSSFTSDPFIIESHAVAIE